MKKLFLFLVGVLLGAFLAKSDFQFVSQFKQLLGGESQEDLGENEVAQIANPATVFCQEQGGENEIREMPGGQVGFCVFQDGSECEEWELFRGDCAMGQGGEKKVENEKVEDFSSEDLGITFAFAKDFSENDFEIFQTESQVALLPKVDGEVSESEKESPGIFVEVFTKKASMKLKEAIAENFLTESQVQNCTVEITKGNGRITGKIIGKDPDEDLTAPVLAKLCGERASGESGKYFLIPDSTERVEKFLFIATTDPSPFVESSVKFFEAENKELENEDAESEVLSFEDCLQSGGELAESLPRQCILRGQTFIEEDESEETHDGEKLAE